MTSKQLLLSIHDVTPGHGRRIAQLERMLEPLVGGRGGYAMLVVPDFHGRWPVAGDRRFQAWLRGRAEAGVEMLLHGWSHRDPTPAGFRARHMTAGEGEFARLEASEARRRLRHGRKLLEDVLGRPVDAFVAPAWLYGEGAIEALAAEGFALAESHMRVWSPASGATLARGPVVTYASRSRARAMSSLLWSRAATTLLRPMRVVRLALHPHDVDVPALTAESGRAIQAFLDERRLGSYRGLLA